MHELAEQGAGRLRTVWDYLVTVEPPREADVIFCFGSRDPGVPVTAARLYAAGVAPWVLVTGGARGRTTHPTESEAFAAALVEQGVPAGRLILEPRASHTGENVALGMAAMAHRGLPVRSAALVSWPLSMRRCAATFGREFPAVRTFPCPSTPRLPTTWAASPGLVRRALGELARLTLYAELGYILAQAIPPGVIEAADWLGAAYAG